MPPREVYLPATEMLPDEIAAKLFKTSPLLADNELSIALKNRNKQWENNALIPSWVDIYSVEADRFFTNPDVARECYQRMNEIMQNDNADVSQYCYVEPSAGKGAFYNLLPEDRRIGLDIMPDHDEYTLCDFLSWNPKVNGRRYAVIGNPPFGYRGWLALSFVNHASTFADYLGMILPMSFQSEGKGSPKHRVIGAELVQQEYLPPDAFTTEDGRPVKINALWQVWRRGVNNRTSVKTCDQFVDLFTVDLREERLCGRERMADATWFLQRTFYGSPPNLVKDFSQVKYGCGYGIVIKRDSDKITNFLSGVDWREYSNLAMHNCCHISMYHIRNALIDGGFVDV